MKRTGYRALVTAIVTQPVAYVTPNLFMRRVQRVAAALNARMVNPEGFATRRYQAAVRADRQRVAIFWFHVRRTFWQ